MAVGRKVGYALALGTVAAGAFVYSTVLTPDSPEELAISDRVEPLSVIGEVGAVPETIEGRWEIQAGSQVGYRVRERLVSLRAASDAVGRTKAVTGGLTVQSEGQDYSVTDIAIKADLAKLESDSGLRDLALRSRGLQTERYPTAEFTGRGPVSLPVEAMAGDTVRFTLDGRLTIRDVTKQVSIPAEARVVGDRAEVVGSFTFPMAEFGIEPPSLANIVTVDPTGTLEFRLLLGKAA